MAKLPWSERVNMLSINPHAATIEDIANLAADASENASLRSALAEKEARVKVLEEAVEYAKDTHMTLEELAELRRRAGKEEG